MVGSRGVWWRAVWAAASVACTPADRSDELTSIEPVVSSTVYDIHTLHVDSDEPVTLTDVVATLPREPGQDRLLVQDQVAGEDRGIEVVLLHPLDDLVVAPGDVLTLTGRVMSHEGRRALQVDAAADIAVVGRAEPPRTFVTEVASWAPYTGMVVSVAALSLTDCGNGAARVGSEQGLGLDLSLLSTVEDVGAGDVLTDVQGVVLGGADQHWIVPRAPAELGVGGGSSPCPRTVAELRESDAGLVVLPSVSVTAVGGGRAFVADAPAGAAAGQALELTLADGVAVGDRVGVSARAVWVNGRLTATVRAVDVVGEDDVQPVVLDAEDITADHDAALVMVPLLELAGPDGVGRVGTAQGVHLADTLLPAGAALPDSGSVAVTGVLQVSVDDVRLLPRSLADVSPL